MADDLSERIETVAGQPKQVTGDGHQVQNQDLDKLIAADQYLKAQEAAAQPHMGLRFTRLKMPGARGGEPGC
jgi:hypothetical protein